MHARALCRCVLCSSALVPAWVGPSTIDHPYRHGIGKGRWCSFRIRPQCVDPTSGTQLATGRLAAWFICYVQNGSCSSMQKFKRTMHDCAAGSIVGWVAFMQLAVFWTACARARVCCCRCFFLCVWMCVPCVRRWCLWEVWVVGLGFVCLSLSLCVLCEADFSHYEKNVKSSNFNSAIENYLPGRE